MLNDLFYRIICNKFWSCELFFIFRLLAGKWSISNAIVSNLFMSELKKLMENNKFCILYYILKFMIRHCGVKKVEIFLERLILFCQVGLISLGIMILYSGPAVVISNLIFIFSVIYIIAMLLKFKITTIKDNINVNNIKNVNKSNMSFVGKIG
jgi:uncharacterized membrane protein YqjE